MTIVTPTTDTTEVVFRQMVERLSRQSVEKHFDCYEDIEWDSPELAMTAGDPRFSLWADDPIRSTDWYGTLSTERQSELGLYRVASAMRLGLEFENILQRGLLAFVFRLPNGSPEYRYLHHEVIEESQHSLMFQEFVNRTGLEVKGLPPLERHLAQHWIIPLNRIFPELFFLFVLGGEDPVDHMQRLQMRAGDSHPLVERIMRIHLTEEARHLSFARNYLKTNVPQLSWPRRQVIALSAPVLYGVMGRLMVLPTRAMCRAVGMPAQARRQAANSSAGRTLLRDAVAKPRRLLAELGCIPAPARWLWKAFGIWEEPKAIAAAD